MAYSPELHDELVERMGKALGVPAWHHSRMLGLTLDLASQMVADGRQDRADILAGWAVEMVEEAEKRDG